MAKERGLKSYQKKDDKKPKTTSRNENHALSSDDMDDEIDTSNEFYKQVEKLRAAKLAAKSENYSRRKFAAPFLPEESLKGRRHITFQDKYEKAVKKIPSIKKATEHYGGEFSGINPTVSRSIKF